MSRPRDGSAAASWDAAPRATTRRSGWSSGRSGWARARLAHRGGHGLDAPGRLDGRLAGGALRAAAALAPGRLGGIAPLDPTGQLERAGFEVTHRCEMPRAGDPSLVLRAVTAR